MSQLAQAVGRVLDVALMTLPAAIRGDAAVALAAHDPCVDALSAFVARRRDSRARVRARDSIRLEAAGLAAAATVPGAAGLATLVLAAPTARDDAVAWATAALATGEVPAAVLCVVERLPAGGDGYRVSAQALLPRGRPEHPLIVEDVPLAGTVLDV